jgi:hypothetical protein
VVVEEEGASAVGGERAARSGDTGAVSLQNFEPLERPCRRLLPASSSDYGGAEIA